MQKKIYLKFVDHANNSEGLEQKLVNIDKLTVSRRGSKQ